MMDWRQTVNAKTPSCASCARAALVGWTRGRDLLPLPLLACRLRRRPVLPSDPPCKRHKEFATPQPQPKPKP